MNDFKGLKLSDELAKISLAEPGSNLSARVFIAIKAKQRQRAYFYGSIHALGLALTAGLAVHYWPAVMAEINQAPLWQLLSLVWTNPTAVAANWHEVGWYVIETLPVLTLSIVAALVWGALATLKNTSEIINLSRSKMKI